MLLNYVEQDYNYMLKKKRKNPNSTLKRILFTLQKKTLKSYKMPEVELPEQPPHNTTCIYGL